MIYTIDRKNKIITVVKMKVSDVNKSKLSKKFIEKYNTGLITDDMEIFIKCDDQGKLLVHGNHYSIFKITKDKL